MIYESLKRNKIGIILMLVSSLMACLGQLLWKMSTQGELLYLLCGFLLYGLGAIIMMVAYRYGSLSVLQPILSVNYVLSLLIGYFILDENISYLNILGVIVIILGVILIAGGD